MLLEIMCNSDYEILNLNAGDDVHVYAEIRKGYDDILLSSSLEQEPDFETKENGFTVSLRFLTNGRRDKFDFFSKGIWKPDTLEEQLDKLRSIIDAHKGSDVHILVDLESFVNDEALDLGWSELLDIDDLDAYEPMMTEAV